MGQKGGKVKYSVIKCDCWKREYDASGRDGGGEILIGGDYQGKNPLVPNAARTYVGSDAVINASALENGDGGKVILWANEDTRFYGTILARGGADSGNGGFVEVSGKESLDFNGVVDASAPQGTTGTLLLDPQFLIVATSGGSAYTTGVNNLFANNPTGTNTITPASINAANANITLQANTDVTFTDALAMTNAGRTLTVQAGRSILINNTISTTNAAVTMTANDNTATSADRVAGNGDITMAGGTSINAGTGAISLTVGPSIAAPFSPGSITTKLTGSTVLCFTECINRNGNIAATGH